MGLGGIVAVLAVCAVFYAIGRGEDRDRASAPPASAPDAAPTGAPSVSAPAAAPPATAPDQPPRRAAARARSGGARGAARQPPRARVRRAADRGAAGLEALGAVCGGDPRGRGPGGGHPALRGGRSRFRPRWPRARLARGRIAAPGRDGAPQRSDPAALRRPQRRVVARRALHGSRRAAGVREPPAQPRQRRAADGRRLAGPHAVRAVRVQHEPHHHARGPASRPRHARRGERGRPPARGPELGDDPRYRACPGRTGAPVGRRRARPRVRAAGRRAGVRGRRRALRRGHRPRQRARHLL